jgi:hypothetical protein
MATGVNLDDATVHVASPKFCPRCTVPLVVIAQDSAHELLLRLCNTRQQPYLGRFHTQVRPQIVHHVQLSWYVPKVFGMNAANAHRCSRLQRPSRLWRRTGHGTAWNG